MQKAHLIVIFCLFTLTFGFITPRNVGFKQVENTHCPEITCVGEGQTCQSSDCSVCSDAFTSCFSGATTPSAWCDCYNQVVDCLADYPVCDAFQIQDQCTSFFKQIGAQCACGGEIHPTPASICDFDDYCGSDQKCHPLKPANSTCSNDDECLSRECQNGVCYSDGWAYPGDSCKLSSDCIGSPLTNCINGICVGGSVGSACAEYTCAFGLFCEPTTQKCAKIKSPGQTCTRDKWGGDTGDCGVFGICGFNDKCVNLFSQPIGSNCNQTVECQLGLYCSPSGQCLNPIKKSCTSDSDCTDGHYCSCNFDGTSTCSGSQPFASSDCQSPLVSYIKCATAHQCNPTSNGTDPGSCIYKYCRNEGNCYLSCFIGSNELYPASCFGKQPPCNNKY